MLTRLPKGTPMNNDMNTSKLQGVLSDWLIAHLDILVGRGLSVLPILRV